LAEGKWVADLRPDLAVSEAARIALSARLEVVRQYLPVAAASAAEDIEHIHHLRVSTRRASAALNQFAISLPQKRLRSAKKLLRSIRRAAGQARDWDVFHTMLVALDLAHEREVAPARHLLFGYTAARRMDAQELIASKAPKWSTRLERRIDDVLAHLRAPSDGEPSVLADLALTRLQELMLALHTATDPVPSDNEGLHRARIAGKRLRYAMELYVDCFRAPFREELYPLIEEMQEILGQLNDNHVASRHLLAVREHLRAFHPAEWPEFEPSAEGLFQSCRQRLLDAQARFEAWLPRWRQAIALYPLEWLRLSPDHQADTSMGHGI
jgi:CHAD domain-containing protein